MATKVSLGRTMATRALMEALKGAHEVETVDQILFPYFQRHARGDYGEVDEHDVQLNEDSVQEKGRIISAYRTEMGVNFWIITDPGWEVTTALLPEDY